jgi:hypothetical protein
MMIFPCFGFLFLLFLACGATSLVAAADPHRAANAPKFYPVSFAGVGLIGFALSLSSISGSDVGGLLLLIGSPLIITCGAIIGYRAGVRRKEQAETLLAKQAKEKSLM